MSWLITNLIAALLLPPLNILLLAAGGGWLLSRRPRLGKALLATAFALLWLLSTPWLAEGGLSWLESRVPPLGKQPAEAIVVLGGGSYFQAPEWDGQNTVSRDTLLRLRYAAHLQRQTGQPILVSGGAPLGNGDSEAAQMQQVLTQELHVPVRWQETRSRNTYENALLSAPILHAAGIRRIYLVSHAWHLPRAVAIFQRAGFEVVPAPTAFTTRYDTTLLTFLPSAEALEKSRIVGHELIGLGWYWLRGIRQSGSGT